KRLALDQHFEIEFFCGESFECVLADGAEMIFLHVTKQALLQIGVADLARIIVAKDSLDLVRRKNLANDIEDRVAFECISNLLQLVEELLEDVPFDSVRRHEVEDQAVFCLEVAMDSSHSLLQSIWVPRDVIVEQNVAALEI